MEPRVYPLLTLLTLLILLIILVLPAVEAGADVASVVTLTPARVRDGYTERRRKGRRNLRRMAGQGLTIARMMVTLLRALNGNARPASRNVHGHHDSDNGKNPSWGGRGEMWLGQGLRGGSDHGVAGMRQLDSGKI